MLPLAQLYALLIMLHQLWVPTLMDAFARHVVKVFVAEGYDPVHFWVLIVATLDSLKDIKVPQKEKCLVPNLAAFHAGEAAWIIMPQWIRINKNLRALEAAATKAADVYHNHIGPLLIADVDVLFRALTKLPHIGKYVGGHCVRSMAVLNGLHIKPSKNWGCLAMSDRSVGSVSAMLRDASPETLCNTFADCLQPDAGALSLVLCETSQVLKFIAPKHLSNDELLTLLREEAPATAGPQFESAVMKLRRLRPPRR